MNVRYRIWIVLYSIIACDQSHSERSNFLPSAEDEPEALAVRGGGAISTSELFGDQDILEVKYVENPKQTYRRLKNSDDVNEIPLIRGGKIVAGPEEEVEFLSYSDVKDELNQLESGGDRDHGVGGMSIKSNIRTDDYGGEDGEDDDDDEYGDDSDSGPGTSESESDEIIVGKGRMYDSKQEALKNAPKDLAIDEVRGKVIAGPDDVIKGKYVPNPRKVLAQHKDETELKKGNVVAGSVEGLDTLPDAYVKKEFSEQNGIRDVDGDGHDEGNGPGGQGYYPGTQKGGGGGSVSKVRRKPPHGKVMANDLEVGKAVKGRFLESDEVEEAIKGLGNVKRVSGKIVDEDDTLTRGSYVENGGKVLKRLPKLPEVKKGSILAGDDSGIQYIKGIPNKEDYGPKGKRKRGSQDHKGGRPKDLQVGKGKFYDSQKEAKKHVPEGESVDYVNGHVAANDDDIIRGQYVPNPKKKYQKLMDNGEDVPIEKGKVVAGNADNLDTLTHIQRNDKGGGGKRRAGEDNRVRPSGSKQHGPVIVGEDLSVGKSKDGFLNSEEAEELVQNIEYNGGRVERVKGRIVDEDDELVRGSYVQNGEEVLKKLPRTPDIEKGSIIAGITNGIKYIYDIPNSGGGGGRNSGGAGSRRGGGPGGGGPVVIGHVEDLMVGKMVRNPDKKLKELRKQGEEIEEVKGRIVASDTGDFRGVDFGVGFSSGGDDDIIVGKNPQSFRTMQEALDAIGSASYEEARGQQLAKGDDEIQPVEAVPDPQRVYQKIKGTEERENGKILAGDRSRVEFLSEADVNGGGPDSERVMASPQQQSEQGSISELGRLERLKKMKHPPRILKNAFPNSDRVMSERKTHRRPRRLRPIVQRRLVSDSR